ncbi:putative orfan [Tupanvirus soda lake]|uniref:Orfan n=2 Tax=Tupanvirus TaxID=2094720 RepID=A0AC62ADB5_9VIRU|nr:putative orfan [Tupanvirus soda lake]QKU35731.1 putative orfan [Tupanvirus soda lake]
MTAKTIITHTFISSDKQNNQLSDTNLNKVPLLANLVNLQSQSNSNSNTIKTSITSLGFDCIKQYLEYGDWPVYAMKFGAIIQGFSLEEALDYLLIDERPYFHLDSITNDLIWMHENNVKVHLRFNTNDYGKISYYLNELDFAGFSDDSIGWNKGELYSISQTYFDIIDINDSNQLPHSVQIELNVSLDSDQIEMLTEHQVRSSPRGSEPRFSVARSARYHVCINCEDDYCNICDKHPNDCTFCEDCGECLGAACACDRAIDLEMRDREESDEKKDKQRYRQIKKRLEYEADLDDYIERKYDRAQVGVDAD